MAWRIDNKYACDDDDGAMDMCVFDVLSHPNGFAQEFYQNILCFVIHTSACFPILVWC